MSSNSPPSRETRETAPPADGYALLDAIRIEDFAHSLSAFLREEAGESSDDRATTTRGEGRPALCEICGAPAVDCHGGDTFVCQQHKDEAVMWEAVADEDAARDAARAALQGEIPPATGGKEAGNG